MNLIRVASTAFAALVCLTSCEDSNSTTVENALWINDWTHSFEEDPPNSQIQIYRPTISSTFPVSHFRMRYLFNADGTCEYLVLDPADAHYSAKGTWKVDPKDPKRVLISKDGTVNKRVSFTILEVEENLLKIEREG